MIKFFFITAVLLSNLAISQTKFSAEISFLSDPFSIQRNGSLGQVDLSGFVEKENRCYPTGTKGGYRYFTYESSKPAVLELNGQTYSLVTKIEDAPDYNGNPYHFMRSGFGSCEDIREFKELERIGLIFKHDKFSTYYVFLQLFPKRDEAILHETFSGKKYKGRLNSVKFY